MNNYQSVPEYISGLGPSGPSGQVKYDCSMEEKLQKSNNENETSHQVDNDDDDDDDGKLFFK
jgi:hypothetical protein